MEDLNKKGKNDRYFNYGCWTIIGIGLIIACISLLEECNKEKVHKPKFFDTGCYLADVNYYNERTEESQHYTAIVYIDNNNRLKKMELLNGLDVVKVVDGSILKTVDYEEWGFSVYFGKHSDEDYRITVVGRPMEPCEYDSDDPR